MIEVRIPRRDFAEYHTQEGATAYVRARLLAAGAPIDSNGTVKHGTLIHYTLLDGDYFVYQWTDEEP